jgi:hypothetical protein
VFVSNVFGQPLRCLNDGQGVHAGEPCRHPTTKAGCSELNACTCVVRKAAGAGDRGACIVEYTYAAEDAARALQSLRISVAAQFQPASRDSAFEISNFSWYHWTYLRARNQLTRSHSSHF